MRSITTIKLVALDVDGTLLGKDLKIPPRTREAIMQARARGVLFAIVTGRMYQSAAPYAAQLGLAGAPLVAYNGALVREFPSGRVLFHEPLPLDACRSLAAFCEARGYHLQAYVDDQLYVSKLDERTMEYTSVAGVEARAVGSLFFWFSRPSTKLLMIDDPARIPRIQEEVQHLLGPAASVAPSYPSYLEVVSRKVSKGAALKSLAESLGLDRHEVMAVGDGMNDLPMLSWAGTSFAISHAPAALKQAVTHVTKSGPGDGVAEALEMMGLAGAP